MGELLWALQSHPDAAKPASDNDPARARGFHSFTLFASGGCSVLYHWGSRSFASVAEVDVWLAGGVPDSWKP